MLSVFTNNVDNTPSPTYHSTPIYLSPTMHRLLLCCCCCGGGGGCCCCYCCSLQGDGSTSLILASYFGHTDIALALIATPSVDINHANVSNNILTHLRFYPLFLSPYGSPLPLSFFLPQPLSLSPTMYPILRVVVVVVVVAFRRMVGQR